MEGKMKNKLITGRVEVGLKIPGSKLANCSQCNKVVWISPSSFKELEEEAEIICTDCFFSSKKEIKLEDVAEISEGQLNELERVLGYRPSKEEVMEKFGDFVWNKWKELLTEKTDRKD